MGFGSSQIVKKFGHRDRGFGAPSSPPPPPSVITEIIDSTGDGAGNTFDGPFGMPLATRRISLWMMGSCLPGLF